MSIRLALSITGMLAAAVLACVRSGAPPVATASRAVAATPVASAAPASAAPVADAFTREVAPILARRCAPCHNPGGSLYAKLPFDDAATVRGHREGVLRRLKGDDLAAVTRWLDSP